LPTSEIIAHVNIYISYSTQSLPLALECYGEQKKAVRENQNVF